MRTRRERASQMRKEQKEFFDQFKVEARAILDALLENMPGTVPRNSKFLALLAYLQSLTMEIS